VTLFEATILAGRRHARVDILQKTGNAIRLIEVKAKSFNGQEHLASRADGGNGVLQVARKTGGISAKWREKLEDITYQVLLLEKILPGASITPFLALVDTSKRARANNVPGFFELVWRTGRDGEARLQTARYTGTPEQIADPDLVTEVDVSEEVAMLRDEVEQAAALFESRLDQPFDIHVKGVEPGARCIGCEFRHDEVDLAPYLRGPVFEPLVTDRSLFAAVRVDPECETIVWPNGADMDPDVLYEYELVHVATGRGRAEHNCRYGTGVCIGGLSERGIQHEIDAKGRFMKTEPLIRIRWSES